VIGGRWGRQAASTSITHRLLKNGLQNAGGTSQLLGLLCYPLRPSTMAASYFDQLSPGVQGAIEVPDAHQTS
jgi:hypothetical protein